MNNDTKKFIGWMVIVVLVVLVFYSLGWMPLFLFGDSH